MDPEVRRWLWLLVTVKLLVLGLYLLGVYLIGKG
ncbi:hypothetical protein Mterra_00801 [Calidithermus terrae]|uniref:Uncharacterized protein n=1 Tax=Calidithermus terrae TaxID=1408545 RepID=A0A399EZU6_9DEIN|nr:hypothetical protein Mterra_00801 [Calidithermus terrae]